MADDKTFGERLKHFRKRAGFTQEKLSYLVGVHETTIRAWENNSNRKPKTDEIKKLCEVLHVSETELLNGTPENEKSWLLHVEFGSNSEEFVDMKTHKPQAVIITDEAGGFLKLGGDYELWNDDAGFKKLIKQLHTLRATVIQNGRVLGAVKD